jgi:DNA mismatch endonuclease, patch repair protein
LPTTVDVVDKTVRSRMMSGIRGKNTKPELKIRGELHKRGFRFRLHDKKLPGKPDIVLPKYGAIILVNGCFWHGHECHLFKWPSTRPGFWKDKIGRSRTRDKENLERYQLEGWRVLTVWECALKGKQAPTLNTLMNDVEEWIREGSRIHEILGEGGAD